MSEKNPLVIFVPSSRFLRHALQEDPEFLTRNCASKEGTTPFLVEVRHEVTEKGVYVTLDPYLWEFKLATKVMALAGRSDWYAQYRAEVRELGHTAGRAAVEAFPEFHLWLRSKFEPSSDH